MAKLGDLRAWAIRNPPAEPTCEIVQTPEEAINILSAAIATDLKDESVWSNAFGLEKYEDVGNEGGPEWCEWYNDEGQDIMEIMDEGEM